jgi:hypothetical protein
VTKTKKIQRAMMMPKSTRRGRCISYKREAKRNEKGQEGKQRTPPQVASVEAERSVKVGGTIDACRSGLSSGKSTSCKEARETEH